MTYTGRRRTEPRSAGWHWQDADKLTDALTFRLAVETGAADVLARQYGGEPGRPRPMRC